MAAREAIRGRTTDVTDEAFFKHYFKRIDPRVAESFSAEQKAARARDMEIYAGMIDYMDGCIGRLLRHLRKSGDYDDTLIVFISDNGPSRTTILDYLQLGGMGGDFFSR